MQHVCVCVIYVCSYRLNKSIRSNCQALELSAKHADPEHNVLQHFIMKFGCEVSNTTKNIAIMIKYFHYIWK